VSGSELPENPRPKVAPLPSGRPAFQAVEGSDEGGDRPAVPAFLEHLTGLRAHRQTHACSILQQSIVVLDDGKQLWPASRPSSIGTDPPGKFGHLLPIGKIHHGFGVRRSPGDPHDEAYDQAVDCAVSGVIQFSGKYRQVRRLPGDLPQQFPHVGIGLGPAFCRLSGHEINREKGVGFAFQNRHVPPDEIDHLPAVFPIADAGADHDPIEGFQVQGCSLPDGNQPNPVAVLPFHHLLHAQADFSGVAIGCRVEEENPGHGDRRSEGV